jgi:hypothetical protein
LLTRNPDFQASEPTLLAGTFIRGIRTLPITFTPER